MAIGDTVQAGLMRVDFSPFLEAGRANAAANASFGQALGQVAKGYIEGQEKKKRANEIAGFLMGQGVSEKDAQAIAKNPFLQNEYQRGQETKAKMKMERERLATQANIAAQGRAARQAEIEQQNERADAETQRLIGFSENLISETIDPAVQQNADMARPGLFALGGDPEMRNRFLDAEIERQPKVTVGSLGSEDFATFARETGMDPRLSANRFMGLQKIEEAEELANQPKPMTPKEEAELQIKLLDIENKKLEIASQEIKNEGDLNKLEKQLNPPIGDESYTGSVLEAIDGLYNILEEGPKLGGPVSGFGAETFMNIGGTNAANAAAYIKTIMSDVAFSRLQKMRNDSPTGGALGQVSNIELELLKSAKGSLDQRLSPKLFRKNLDSIKLHYDNFMRSIQARKLANQQGLTFKTVEQAIAWMDQNVPMGGKPTPDNQTNITTPGGFVLSDN